MGGYLSSSSPSAQKIPDVSNNNNAGDTVVIPVDESQQAETAFLWYVKHVHRPENVIRVIHCKEPPHSTPMLAEQVYQGQSSKVAEEHSHQLGKNIVSKYEEKLKEHRLTGTVALEVGKPGETVIKEVDKHQATMVVMGTRGFGLVRRTILGSVSEYVIHHTRVPVTVIPKETQSWFF